MNGDEREEMDRLLAENRWLRELLTEHGIAWQPRDITPTAVSSLEAYATPARQQRGQAITCALGQVSHKPLHSRTSE